MGLGVLKDSGNKMMVVNCKDGMFGLLKSIFA